MASGARRGQAPDIQALLSQAIAAADVPAILHLLEDPSLDLDKHDVGHDLQTPLMRLCHMREATGSLDRILEKLERCAWNPNVRDSGGRTLIMHGCISRRPSVVLLCLENGCDVELTDRDGDSVLVYAVRNGGLEMVSLLLEMEECRALLTATNNLGQTPLDVAHQDGLTAIAACLESHASPLEQQRAQQSATTNNNNGAPPPFLTPRPNATPSSFLQQPPAAQIRRTCSESSQTGLGLGRLSDDGSSGHHHQQQEQQQQQGPHDEGRRGRKKGGGGGDLVSLVSSRLASSSSASTLPPAVASRGPGWPHGVGVGVELEASSVAPTLASFRSRESTGLEPGLLSSREVMRCSDSGAGDLSPRKARRRQRLLRRHRANSGDVEETSEMEGGGAGGGGRGGSPRRDGPSRRGAGGGAGRSKPLPKQLHYRKNSDSLPDLRDFKGKLVASGEATPVGSDQSDVSVGRGVGPADETAAAAAAAAAGFVEVTACSLPQIPKAPDQDAHRTAEPKDRAHKLVHGARKPNTDDVMLRSLIV